MYDPNFTRMPFGKHKGSLISELPDDYLEWLLTKATIEREWLKEAFRDERLRRQRGEQRQAPEAEQPPWAEILREWYRFLSQQFHPDRGGSHEAMKALNCARDLLEELLKERAN